MILKGKTALVTGAARGIGKAVALRLALEGAAVVLIDLRDTSPAAEEIEKKGGRAVPLEIDITDSAAVTKAVAETASRLGGIDILVNNAGIIARGTVLDLDIDLWKRVMEVNVNGTFNCCRAVLPYMIKQGGGKILNITSIAGKMGDITAAPVYGTSKGAVNTLTKSLARQLAGYHINVNAVAPHAIETDMRAEWSPEKRHQVIDGIPLKRLGKPEEVAEAALFLVSEAASFITGEILNVNDGALMD